MDLNQLVLPVRQQLIVKAMAVGTASLKSIYEHLKAIPTMKLIELGGCEKRGKLIAQICP